MKLILRNVFEKLYSFISLFKNLIFILVQLKNDYKQSKSSSEYLLISLRIGMFLAIFLAYMTFKYFYVIEGFERIRKFSYVFNSTQYSQSDIVLSTNIIK